VCRENSPPNRFFKIFFKDEEHREEANGVPDTDVTREQGL
jgi:hypothetical protein